MKTTTQPNKTDPTQEKSRWFHVLLAERPHRQRDDHLERTLLKTKSEADKSFIILKKDKNTFFFKIKKLSSSSYINLRGRKKKY